MAIALLLTLVAALASSGSDSRTVSNAQDVAQPRLVVGRGSDCWSLRAEQFPALSERGDVIVTAKRSVKQLSSVPGTMTVELISVENGASTRSFELLPDMQIPEDAASCRRFRRKLVRRVREANRALAERRWQPLQRLPIATVERASTGLYRLETQPRDRHVQLVLQHGELIARIPGVQVLERHPWKFSNAEPVAAYGDRQHGLAVILAMRCAGTNCTCDPQYESTLVRWREETFDAVTRRPCRPEQTPNCLAESYDFPLDPWRAD